MFQTIAKTWHQDTDYPDRTFTIQTYGRILDGTFYDRLEHGFHEETAAGEYIPLHTRRPSNTFNLCKTVVDDSVSLLFSEGHFPEVDCGDAETRRLLRVLVKEADLNGTMVEAAFLGSVGSIAILFKVLSNRPYFEVMPTPFLTPEFDPQRPDTLSRLTEQYKLTGKALAAEGYNVEADDERYWFRREWTKQAENWYLPLKVSDAKEGAGFVLDQDRTVQHRLGFVPISWIKNLPGGKGVDGGCTFQPAINNQISIDYQLSQASRALKYSGDPTKVIKDNDTGFDTVQIIGAANAIKVSSEGDVKLLEITGDSANAVERHVRLLRELALEQIHGNKANADKLSAAQSGRSMELLNQPLVWLADRLRISYGERGIIGLLKMVVSANQERELIFGEEKIPKATLNAGANIFLRWPTWYAPTPSDRQAMASAIDMHVKGGHMSEETATSTIAADYDIEDVPSERARIEADRKAADARAAELAYKSVHG